MFSEQPQKKKMCQEISQKNYSYKNVTTAHKPE